MSYDEWEEKQGPNPVSPESHYARKAWNAAIQEAKLLVSFAKAAEGGASATVAKVVTFIDSELDGLLTE